jgi:hypothetical protein
MHGNIRYSGFTCSLTPINHFISTRKVVLQIPFIVAVSLLEGCVKDKSNKYVITVTRLSGVFALFDSTMQTLFYISASFQMLLGRDY